MKTSCFQLAFLHAVCRPLGSIGGVKLKETLQLGYSFEIPTNKNLGFQYNTHEVTLRFDMKALAFHQHRIQQFLILQH